MSVEDAYQRALNTLQKWVQKEVNTTKTLVALRTYSPAHVGYVYVTLHYITYGDRWSSLHGLLASYYYLLLNL
jgi:hypothetical protein